jgi:hypothetical protein
MKVCKAFVLISTIFIITTTKAIADINSIGVYGISTHNDDNNGKGYNEKNIGFSVYYDHFKYQSIDISSEYGMFRNSFYDDAYFVGIESVYNLNDFLSFGFTIRHWETVNNTYAKRIATVYPRVRLRLTPSISLDYIMRKSGQIYSLKINLK